MLDLIFTSDKVFFEVQRITIPNIISDQSDEEKVQYKRSNVLCDQTLVGGKIWSEMKESAMQEDYKD